MRYNEPPVSMSFVTYKTQVPAISYKYLFLQLPLTIQLLHCLIVITILTLMCHLEKVIIATQYYLHVYNFCNVENMAVTLFFIINFFFTWSDMKGEFSTDNTKWKLSVTIDIYL